jgi:hypothetical protein
MNDFQLTNPENADLCDPSKSQWYLGPPVEISASGVNVEWWS